MPGFEFFGEEERKHVSDVLDVGVLFRYGFDGQRNGNWKVKEFESKLCEITDSKHALLTSSGTTALSAAIAACGIGAEDEVIVPPFTFVATIEGVLAAGAVPIFAEIDNTLCLDPSKLENFVTERTKAVIVVHMCGAMAHIQEIREFCDKRGIILIEDACQAFGGTYHGKYLGTFGNIGCYSFDAVKLVTCGEGGGIVTNSQDLYLRADAYHDHGHDHIGNDRGLEKHEFIGHNFRASELNAAIGLAQLGKLHEMVAIQRKNKQAIYDGISEIQGIEMRNIPDEEGDSATFVSFMLPNEDTARKAAAELKTAGVDGAFFWYDNNWHYIRKWDHIKKLNSMARLPHRLYPNLPDYENISLPQSDSIMSRTISMQIKLGWSAEDLEIRINQMKEVLSNL